MKIAIASGKGGTGKTLVSTNLFYALEQEGISVSLVDCDAEEPNAGEFIRGDLAGSSPVTQKIPVIDPEKCVFCGKCHEYCHYHAILYLPPLRFIQVVESLCHDCGACFYACKHGAITEKEKILGAVKTELFSKQTKVIEGRANIGVYSPVSVIKKAIHSINGESAAIFDSPPGISCPFIVTVNQADFVVLVTEPTPFGLNDLKLSVATLKHLHKPHGVIVNRTGMGDNAVYEWLVEMGIPLLMEIPFDKEIARIYSEGRLLALEKPEYRRYFVDMYDKIKQLLS